MANNKIAYFTKINFILGSALVVMNALFYIAPMLTTHLAWLIGIALLYALVSTPFWSLIHEAIHRAFCPNKKMNDQYGRIMAILFGTTFQIVQYSHLMHHRMNRRPPDLIDAYDSQQESFIKKSLLYYLHILGGLYLLEVITPLFTFLPIILLDKLLQKTFGANSPYYSIAKKKLLNQTSLREMRIDAAILYLMLTSAIILYATHIWVFILGLLLRAFFISYADNLPHYRTPIDQYDYAYNTYLPTPLRFFWLNFNLHRVHHEAPSLPWYTLHQAFIERKEKYDTGYFKQAAKQLKGVWAINKK